MQPGSLQIPSIAIPPPPLIPAPPLELPRAVLPSYTPLVIPQAAETDTPPVPLEQREERDEPAPETPQNLQQLVREALRQAQAEPSARQVAAPSQALPEPLVAAPSAEVTQLVVPGTQLKIPVPKAEILSAAATTSVISVGATLAATSMFKRLVQVMKPAFKAAAAKIAKVRGKPLMSWGRQRLLARHQRKPVQTANLRGSCNPVSKARRT
jgi:hypothetical protein